MTNEQKLLEPDAAREKLTEFFGPEYHDYINKLAGDFAGNLVKLLNTRTPTASAEGCDPVIERDRLWCRAIVNTQYQSDCLKLNVGELLAEVERLRFEPPPAPEVRE